MHHLIKNISSAIGICKSFEEDFLTKLQSFETLWKMNYPIAMVHDRSRFKHPNDTTVFENNNLFDAKGHTPTKLSESTLSLLQKEAPSAFKTAHLAAFSAEPDQTIDFDVKRPNDYWKKIQNISALSATLDFACFDKDESICKIEFELREVIRAQKEVPALKPKGFIWMAVCKKDLSKLFRLYFNENYTRVNGDYHIGWSESLQSINMRDFICPPQ